MAAHRSPDRYRDDRLGHVLKDYKNVFSVKMRGLVLMSDRYPVY